MTLAVVVVATERRRQTTFRRCMESVLAQRPDEIVVVADFPVQAKGVRSLVIPKMLGTTVDALVRRDCGWMASLSDNICYLCDDHVLAEGFVQALQTYEPLGWHVLVPSRFCRSPDEGTQWLNVGQELHYAGGHCAIYRRMCGYLQPWASTFHHPNWDTLHSMQLRDQGCDIVYAGKDLAVEDLEPEAQPWTMTADQQAKHQAFLDSVRRAG